MLDRGGKAEEKIWRGGGAINGIREGGRAQFVREERIVHSAVRFSQQTCFIFQFTYFSLTHTHKRTFIWGYLKKLLRNVWPFDLRVTPQPDGDVSFDNHTKTLELKQAPSRETVMSSYAPLRRRRARGTKKPEETNHLSSFFGASFFPNPQTVSPHSNSKTLIFHQTFVYIFKPTKYSRFSGPPQSRSSIIIYLFDRQHFFNQPN